LLEMDGNGILYVQKILFDTVALKRVAQPRIVLSGVALIGVLPGIASTGVALKECCWELFSLE